MGNNNLLDEYEFEETLTLSLDDGTELECAIVSIFPAGDYEYIALLPTEPVEGFEDGEVFLYRFKESEDGEPILNVIEDDDEFEIVSDAFDEILDSLEYEEDADEEE